MIWVAHRHQLALASHRFYAEEYYVGQVRISIVSEDKVSAAPGLDGIASAPDCIWLVTPPGSKSAPCFVEVAEALQDGFKILGIQAPIVTQPDQVRRRALVLNPHAADLRAAPQNSFVLFNLEQVSDQSGFFDDIYCEMLKRFEVWDYSSRNIALLAERGIHARLCQIGYAPVLTRIPAAPHRDVDIVFVGSASHRRYKVLNALHSAGKNVVAISNCFGAERDALYARAKIVLNIHILDAQIFEIVRCSYLLANRMCIVSETGKDQPLEAPLRDAIAFAEYEGLVDLCLELLENEARREAIAQRGYDIFMRMTQANYLKAVLERDAIVDLNRKGE